jgi:predicted P-loop ATPase
MFTIAGTCNDDDFLVEAEDNRRFWIIEIEKKICFDVFIPEIDAMWSACVNYIKEYLEQSKELEPHEALRRLCELSEAEKQQLKYRSKRFAMFTGWDDVVEEFLNKNPREYYWHTEIEEYAKVNNIVPAGNYPQQKIKDALRRLGYEQYKNPVSREYKGYKSKKRWWHNPQGTILPPLEEVSDEEAYLDAQQAELDAQEAYMEAYLEASEDPIPKKLSSPEELRERIKSSKMRRMSNLNGQ